MFGHSAAEGPCGSRRPPEGAGPDDGGTMPVERAAAFGAYAAASWLALLGSSRPCCSIERRARHALRAGADDRVRGDVLEIHGIFAAAAVALVVWSGWWNDMWLRPSNGYAWSMSSWWARPPWASPTSASDESSSWLGSPRSPRPRNGPSCRACLPGPMGCVWRPGTCPRPRTPWSAATCTTAAWRAIPGSLSVTCAARAWPQSSRPRESSARSGRQRPPSRTCRTWPRACTPTWSPFSGRRSSPPPSWWSARRTASHSPAPGIRPPS